VGLRIDNNPGTRTVRSILISCDVCHVEVSDTEIAKRGGLLEMGWLRRFNSETRNNEYFCPEHHPEEESRGN
jgi:hypothetical protein